MKKTKFTGAQIVFALRRADTGITVAEVSGTLGRSVVTVMSGERQAAAAAHVSSAPPT